MRSIKRILSLCLSLVIIAGLFSVTGVVASAEETKAPLRVIETFDDFSIDYDNKTMTSKTQSGLTFGAENAYSYSDKFKVTDGALYSAAYGAATHYDTPFWVDFEPITSGKVEIAFDINFARFNHSAGFGRNFFEVQSQDESATKKAVTLSTSDYKTHGITLNTSTVTSANQTNTWYNVKFLFDINEQTYDFYIDGEAIETGKKFNQTLSNINRLYFAQGDNSGYYGAIYTVDNIKVVEDPDNAKVTVTFKNGSETFETQTVDFAGNATLPETNPTQSGKVFLGWVDESGNEVSADDLKFLTEDKVVTAKFKDAVRKIETFDNFTLDNTNKTVSTTSGFAVSAGDTFYSLNATASGMLYAKAYSANISSGGDMSMTFSFPEITSGKVEVSYDLAFAAMGFSNWIGVYSKPYFTIGNSESGNNAAALYARGMNGTNTIDSEVYLTTAYGKNGTDENVIGTVKKGTDLQNIKYIIDLDNQTYSVTWGGVTTSDIAFASAVDSIDNFKIQFASDVRNKNCDIQLDNLKVVEDPDNAKVTVTFKNGSETFETQTVDFAGNATLPETNPTEYGKVFLGWVDESGNKVLADDLKCLTENKVLTAKFKETFKAIETFDDFSIDYANKTMTSQTQSGLTFGAENAYSYSDRFKVTDGALYSAAYGGATHYDTPFWVDFPEITSGKVEIAFDINFARYDHSANWRSNFFEVKSSDASVTNTATYLMTSNSSTDGITLLGNTLTSATAKNTWYSVKFLFDMDAKTYDFYVDNETVATGQKFNQNLDGISRLYFAAGNNSGYYGAIYTVDNIKVVEDPDNAKVTVTFKNGSETFETQTVDFAGNVTLPETNPTQSGKIFLGWVDEEGNKVSADDLKCLTEDKVVTAKFKDAVSLTETFDNFTLDNTNKTVSTTSGFAVSAGDTFYSLNATASGMLYAKAYTANISSGGDMSMTFSFPEITSGKVEVSYDLAMPDIGFANWFVVYGTPYFTIGNSIGNAAELYARGITADQGKGNTIYLATKNGSRGDSSNTIGQMTKGTELQNIKYIIDLDNQTYSVTYNGVTTKDIAFTSKVDSIDNFKIQFASDVRNKNCDIYLDNIKVQEAPEDVIEIPDVVTGEFDAKGTERVLQNGETVTLSSGAVLKNAVIDASEGKVISGTTEITGRITFMEDGAICAALGDTVKLYAPQEGEKYAAAFMQTRAVKTSDQSYVMTIVLNGGSYSNAEKAVTFDLGANVYEGDISFRTLITGVPSGITLSAK